MDEVENISNKLLLTNYLIYRFIVRLHFKYEGQYVVISGVATPRELGDSL